MDKGREKRCKQYNRYNLRLTRYRRQRVENDEEEVVPVHTYEPMVPQFQFQEARQQQHQHQQHQQHHRQPPPQQLHQQALPGGSVWSPREEKLLFRAVAEFKTNDNSTTLKWNTVKCIYRHMGGVAEDVRLLKIEWKKITGLYRARHFNELTFLDEECVKDIDLVFPRPPSASSSRSTDKRSVSSGFRSFFTRAEAGALAHDYDEQLRDILASNTEAITELVNLGMINQEQANFARARYANINQPESMGNFSFLTSPAQRVQLIELMMRMPV